MTIVQGTAHEKTRSKLVMEFAVTQKKFETQGVVPDLGMAPRQDVIHVNCCDVPDKEQDLPALHGQCRK
jgi:hypothetical protein